MKPGSRPGGSEALSNKVRDLEAKLRGAPGTEKKPKDLIRAVGKLFIFIFSSTGLKGLTICHDYRRKNRQDRLANANS